MIGCCRDMQRLPEVQQLVRSLAVENESLHEVMIRFTYLSKYLRISSKLATARLLTKALEFFLDFEQEMRELQRACSALSKENDKLEVNFLICLCCVLFLSQIGCTGRHQTVSFGRNGL